MSNEVDDAATPKDDFGLTGDCPLCLCPLPPIWENDGYSGRMACCGKLICESCADDKMNYMHRKYDEFHLMPRDEQAQLRNVCWTCPFCRSDLYPDEKGNKLLKKSRDGHGWADYCLYSFYRMHEPQVGRPRRLDLSMKHLKLAAERGYPMACNELGDFYSGRGLHDDFNIEPSLLDARQNYRRAAEGGHARARSRLAHSYLSEENLGYCKDEEEDVDTAIEFLEKAAGEGYHDSYHYLGNLHFPEFGGKDDINASLSYYRKSAEFRVELSLHRLGIICRSNIYLPNETFSQSDDKVMNLINEDPSTAAMALLELAARQGYFLSQKELALCFTEKLVVGHSMKLFAAAASWMSIARYKEYTTSEDANEWLQRQSTKNTGSMICFNCFANWSGEADCPKFNGCSRCKAAWYCSKKCQTEHWKKGHKNICGGYKIKNWSRGDALKKTLDPFCVGVDPPQKDYQLRNYFLRQVDLHGTSVKQERLDPKKVLEEAAADMGLDISAI